MRKRKQGAFAFLLAKIALFSMASSDEDMPRTRVWLREDGTLECCVVLGTRWGDVEFFRQFSSADTFSSIRRTVEQAILWAAKNQGSMT